MKRSASARSHNAKDTRITNYKAEELFELLYWRDDDGDCLSLSTRQVARALTFGGARVPSFAWMGRIWPGNKRPDLDVNV